MGPETEGRWSEVATGLWQVTVKGVRITKPAKIKPVTVDGVKFRLHKEVLRGLQLLPCQTRMADTGGWSLPHSTERKDDEALTRLREDGARFAT